MELCTQMKRPRTAVITALLLSRYCSSSSRLSCLYYSSELPAAVLETVCNRHLGRDVGIRRKLGARGGHFSLPDPPLCSAPNVPAACLCLAATLTTTC